MILDRYNDYKVKPVQKIKNGYGFRVILKYEDGTSTVQQHAGFHSNKEADEERCVVISDLKRNTYLYNGSIPADEFFTYWVEEIFKKRAKKYSSYYNYRGIINNHIIPFFRKKRMSVINTGDIVRLYMKTYEYSESVAENVRTIMKTSFNDAVAKKAIATNVAKDVMLPKHKKVGYERKIDTSKTLTYEQVLALINGSRGTPIHLMVLFNVIMGLRCSEIIGLKYSDVDFTNQTLSISRQLGIDIEKSREDLAPKTYTKQEILPKTYSSIRTINIPDIVYDAIIQERKTYDKNKRRRSTVFNDLGYICCSTYGRPRSKNFYYKHYKRLLESLNLPNIRWHDLRSTAATMLLKAGFKPKAVSEMMGHAKEIITVDVYGDKDKLVDIDLYELESFINDVRPKLEECISTEEYVIDTSEYLAN